MDKERGVKFKRVFIITFMTLFIDQLSKILVKTNMRLGESIEITDWFHISFLENNGMAFGMEFFDKIFLTLFRIIAVAALFYIIDQTIKRKYDFGFTVGITLIFAGALGNIIDCLFYGIIFDSSAGQVATLFPEVGYGSLFYGKVVDMLYFPLIEGTFPDWFPFNAGESFVFFHPVFNIADSAITIGVFYILIFQRHNLAKYLE